MKAKPTSGSSKKAKTPVPKESSKLSGKTYKSPANAVARSGRRGQGESTMGDGNGMSFGDSADYIYGQETRATPFRSPEYEKSRLAYIAKFDKVDNKLTRPKKKK